MPSYRVLIVENERLTADALTCYLKRIGHEVIASVMAYTQAIQVIERQAVDLVLMDIQLKGKRNGIDIANYLRRKWPNIPHIFLSAQLDRATLNKAHSTAPAGFLSKPIPFTSLFTTIEIAMYGRGKRTPLERVDQRLNSEDIQLQVDPKRICYLAAEHVYVRIYLDNEEEMLHRGPLARFGEYLPPQNFVLIHRSYIVNIHKVEEWTDQSITVGKQELPLSRYRRKEVLRRLKSWGG